MIVIHCSNCGYHESIKTSVKDVKAATAKGWRSYGGGIYCSECVKTLNERNCDKQLNTAEETNEWIYERMLKVRKRYE